MRILKSHPLLKLVNAYLVDASQPSNISYLWNFGSLLAVCLVIQIVTGVTLAMHYSPNVLEAFNSIEHIMRDVNNGWLVRYLHSNTASAFFFLVYLHLGRGMYYGSYRAPRTLVWFIGTIILILMMATAFLGYVLPYGQMSLWGATVITNLISAIPWIGQDIVEFLWGGFSVNNATLNRFFALHFVLPFILAALVLMHLIALHDVAGSSNPLGVSGNYDRVSFAPYYLFKDLITIFIFIFVLSAFVLFMPNVLGDSENYIMANPMLTPPAIVPEWYLLPFYAILRSIPNKLLGVIAMFSAILAIVLLPITDLGRSKGLQFRPLSKFAFFIFVGNFFVLMVLGACHVESPFIELGQVCTAIYFGFFTIVMPVLSLLENTLVDISSYLNDTRTLNFILKVFGSYTGGIRSTLLSSADYLNLPPALGLGFAFLEDLNLSSLSSRNIDYIYILLCVIAIVTIACIFIMDNPDVQEKLRQYYHFLRNVLPAARTPRGEDALSKAVADAALINLNTGKSTPYTEEFGGWKLTPLAKKAIYDRCSVAKDAYNHNGNYLVTWGLGLSKDGTTVTRNSLFQDPAPASKELVQIIYHHRHVAPSPPADKIWERA